jgi:hypothetical protein
MLSETGAPVVSAWSPHGSENAASVRSVVVRVTVATSAVLALASLVATRTNDQVGPTLVALVTLLLVVQIPFVSQMAETLRASRHERNQSIDSDAVAEAAESLRTTLGSFRFVLDEPLLDR